MYTALYRKWRPMTFDDVVSQPHITAALKRQVAEGKTAHAYLFTGSRGTGKTTCSRILAKAINCLHPIDGKPCLECEICKAADAGTLPDIIEIDAASNNGVNDIRDLRESALYTPERCKYKVYIIDEVHMISVGAFNALLKIMEEPPEHVKFILATTEAHKVPATIVSRCQRFDFRRIRDEDIIDRLLYIAGEEKVDLTRDGAALIARLADGAMRDALSLLEQCMAFSDHIDPEAVSNAAGIAGRDYLFSLIENAADGDAASAIMTVDELYSKSKDMSRLCDELVTQLRNLMLIKTVPDKPELLSCLGEETERLRAVSEKLSLGEILYKLEILQSCAEALPRAVSKRTEFEMSVVKLCTARRADGYNISALEDRIQKLEHQLRNLKSLPEPSEHEDIPAAKSEPAADIKPDKKPEQNNGQFVHCPKWEEILDRLAEKNPGCVGALKGSESYVCGDRMMIVVQNQFFLQLLKSPDNSLALQEAAFAVTGTKFRIGAKCGNVSRAPEAPLKSDNADRSPLDDLIEKARTSGIPIDGAQ